MATSPARAQCPRSPRRPKRRRRKLRQTAWRHLLVETGAAESFWNRRAGCLGGEVRGLDAGGMQTPRRHSQIGTGEREGSELARRSCPWENEAGDWAPKLTRRRRRSLTESRRDGEKIEARRADPGRLVKDGRSWRAARCAARRTRSHQPEPSRATCPGVALESVRLPPLGHGNPPVAPAQSRDGVGDRAGRCN